jgi:hypothetical protein
LCVCVCWWDWGLNSELHRSIILVLKCFPLALPPKKVILR